MADHLLVPARRSDVLLTVFRKQRNNERVEVRRALTTLDRCRKLHQQK